jgi:hypothetical protein
VTEVPSAVRGPIAVGGLPCLIFASGGSSRLMATPSAYCLSTASGGKSPK